MPRPHPGGVQSQVDLEPRSGWPWPTWSSCWHHCLWQGVEVRWSLRTLPTQAILWFCDSRFLLILLIREVLFVSLIFTKEERCGQLVRKYNYDNRTTSPFTMHSERGDRWYCWHCSANHARVTETLTCTVVCDD